MRRRRPDAAASDVLAVCTGNLCRSPIIATLLSARTGLTVASAGTAAPAGEPWHRFAVEVLFEADHPATGQARSLRRQDVEGAQLILTAAESHRVRVLTLDPSAADRSFPLLQAARLLRVAPAAEGIGPAALAQHLAVARQEHPAPAMEDDDLADPIGGEIEDFRICRARITNALDFVAPPLLITN